MVRGWIIFVYSTHIVRNVVYLLGEVLKQTQVEWIVRSQPRDWLENSRNQDSCSVPSMKVGKAESGGWWYLVIFYLVMADGNSMALKPLMPPTFAAAMERQEIWAMESRASADLRYCFAYVHHPTLYDDASSTWYTLWLFNIIPSS